MAPALGGEGGNLMEKTLRTEYCLLAENHTTKARNSHIRFKNVGELGPS